MDKKGERGVWTAEDLNNVLLAHLKATPPVDGRRIYPWNKSPWFV